MGGDVWEGGSAAAAGRNLGAARHQAQVRPNSQQHAQRQSTALPLPMQQVPDPNPSLTSAVPAASLRGELVIGAAVPCPTGGCHWVRLADGGGFMLSEDPVQHGELLKPKALVGGVPLA